MNKSDFASLGKIILALLWAGVVIVGYYIVHKPITFPQAAAFGHAFATFSLALALVGLAGGVGHRLFSPPALFPLERFAIQAA